MYFDSFLKISCLLDKDITPAIEKLEKISAAQGIDFIVSISLDEDELPESIKKNVILAL